MKGKVLTTAAPLVALAACAIGLSALLPPAQAQAPSVASQPQQPAGRGGRGGPPPPPRAGAPVDLTGTWVSVVTEDWQWRMRTPPRGDYASVPLNPAGRKAADSWDPSQDGMCEAYGVGGLMRMPGRVRISWQDDTTLKIESDAGLQTRLLRFATPQSPLPATAQGPRTLQGTSVAEWERSGASFDAFLARGNTSAPRWGSLKVTTTNMLPGWLRRNGVPYSENAVVTEHYTRFTHPEAGDWFIVTTVVDDPQYLTQPFITSSNFKKEPDDSKWSPKPCTAS
jgi:hypothetical protein